MEKLLMKIVIQKSSYIYVENVRSRKWHLCLISAIVIFRTRQISSIMVCGHFSQSLVHQQALETLVLTTIKIYL